MMTENIKLVIQGRFKAAADRCKLNIHHIEHLYPFALREKEKENSFVLEEFIIPLKGSQFYAVAASLNGMVLDRISGRQ